MVIKKSALNALIISLVLVIIALALALIGAAPRFDFGAGISMDYPGLLGAMLAVVLVFLVFGRLRYDLSFALGLGSAALVDQLLTLSLSIIASLVFGLGTVFPAFVIAGAAATACFTLPTLREARNILKDTPRKDINRQAIAQEAVKRVCKLKIHASIAALLLLVLALVAGNIHMPGQLLPLILGLVVAMVSSRFISPYIWAAHQPKRKGKN